jgi:hypothetical protein
LAPVQRAKWSPRLPRANWTYDGELEDGKFSYQLILDNGAEEAVVLPSPESAEVLEELIQDAETLY